MAAFPASLPLPYEPDDVLSGVVQMDDETRELNAWILESKRRAPDMWRFTEDQVRQARRKGEGIFPLEAASPHGLDLELDGPRGPIPLRLIHPSGGSKPSRAYLHIHGGGWTFGEHDMQDQSLQEIADSCHCLCVSVGYGLAPEHPYPAAPDDCEVAARWLLGAGAEKIGLEQFAIGGESAGAHLSLCTLLRLRDGKAPLAHHFEAANLVCGCYDLNFTPSVRNWGDDPLVLHTRDMMEFRSRYLSGIGGKLDLDLPDISPLFADLSDLPPCLITAGDHDPLIDDSLFLHQRLLSAKTPSRLAVYPGGCHVFPVFQTKLARQARSVATSFLNAAFGA